VADMLGRLWQRQGKRAIAHQLLASLYGGLNEELNTPGLQEAKALCTVLAGRRRGTRSTAREDQRLTSVAVSRTNVLSMVTAVFTNNMS